MLEVGWYSLKLFFKGKLLRNPGYFYRQVTFGVIIGLLLLLGLEKTGLNLAIVIGISSLLTGMAMPFLLKDIKMK
ncbi:hypothetical protein [Aphanothece sacrum]|uniref:Uncharacterized protein n=1 Tax=Aphanothece sacrum FPU1 TaxID=1920663 RepID=A0A401ICA6_APHSA|nr:hypothetical protein [Aphanothece sacrum]GBF78918.1 hypothetical protein AsFPU1_0309 [Aphanothece sacrum FPU1]GBF86735.1 hypothetical protein AsFPU3_3808 [Aphanothece sacrum FPU3]